MEYTSHCAQAVNAIKASRSLLDDRNPIIKNKHNLVSMKPWNRTSREGWSLVTHRGERSCPWCWIRYYTRLLVLSADCYNNTVLHPNSVSVYSVYLTYFLMYVLHVYCFTMLLRFWLYALYKMQDGKLSHYDTNKGLSDLISCYPIHCSCACINVDIQK